MNTASNTTAAPRAARDTAVAAAMRNLEDDICSLHNMARILVELLDHDLVEYVDGKKRAMPEPGQALTVYLGYAQFEMLSFAWNDVLGRAGNLKRRFNEAWDAGEAA